MPPFRFSIALTVQEKDVNARGHVSYEKYFLLFQEARVAYLAMFDSKASDINGFGLIAAEARCVYKRELLLGDDIEVRCRISEIKPKSFQMEFLIFRREQLCADGSTTYLYFDYGQKKVAPFPGQLIERIKTYEGMEP